MQGKNSWVVPGSRVVVGITLGESLRSIAARCQDGFINPDAEHQVIFLIK